MPDATEQHPMPTEAPDDAQPWLRELVEALPDLPAFETAHLERMRDGEPSPVDRQPNSTNPAGWLSLDE